MLTKQLGPRLVQRLQSMPSGRSRWLSLQGKEIREWRKAIINALAWKQRRQIKVSRQPEVKSSRKVSLALYVELNLQLLKRLAGTPQRPTQGKASSTNVRWTSDSQESRGERKGSLPWSWSIDLEKIQATTHWRVNTAQNSKTWSEITKQMLSN